MLFRAGLVCLAIALTIHQGMAADAPTAVVPMRSCAEILRATPEVVQRTPAVELEATITFVEADANLLFVHDGTAGIYVHTSGPLAQLTAGMRLHIGGTARPGLYKPVIFARTLEPRGNGELPAAEVTTVTRVDTGALDSQWVELSGIVRRDAPSWSHRVLEVYDGDKPVYVRLKEFEQLDARSLLDAKVTVRGVVANHISEATRPPGYTLYVPHPKHLQVERPATTDPFAAPLVRAGKLADWPGEERVGHLTRVRGVVTFQIPGRWLALQDGDTPLIVESGLTNRVDRGVVVEAAGFIHAAGMPRLVESVWRITSETSEVPVARSAKSWQDLMQAPPGQLVEIAGVLRGLVGNDAVLETHGRLLPMTVRAAPADWLIGADYEITGIVWTGPTNLPAGGRSLWLADARAARLVRSTPSGDWVGARDFLWLGLFAVVVAGWWWQQRRQRNLLDELEATLAFNRAQLVRAEDEQARIARDLHDGVIQSIYAVGMRIEECRKLADTEPVQAREKLATTSEVLNHVIRDVRSFLTGLEPGSIQGREFKTALKSMVLGLGDEAADRIALEINGTDAAALTSKEATELFHICKEALSNSLRHGQATRIQISLRQTTAGCSLTISDNGSGFDPAAVPAGSRGLQNIRTRARNLGADFQLHTGADSGTRLDLRLPKS